MRRLNGAIRSADAHSYFPSWLARRQIDRVKHDILAADALSWYTISPGLASLDETSDLSCDDIWRDTGILLGAPLAFVILPLQYVLAGGLHVDLFSVLIPVYSFLVVPVVSALAGDPARFLECNAKIHWGMMVCVYGLSHAPALLLLEFPGYLGSGAFLLFFLVAVLACGQSAQLAATRRLRRRPLARQISRDFSLRAWWIGALTAALVGAALFWITPFKAPQAMLMAFVAAGAGSFDGLIMQALKRDAGVNNWGNLSAITGAVGLLDRIAVLCFAAPVFFHSFRWYFELAL